MRFHGKEHKTKRDPGGVPGILKKGNDRDAGAVSPAPAVMYTYEMMNEIEALSQGVITFNTLYLTIHRLQDFGYVEEQGKVVSEDNRVRLYFAITPKGEGYLAALIREYRQYTDTVDQILGLPERGKEV